MGTSIGIYLNHPDAKMPTRAYEYDVGYDLYAIEDAAIYQDSVKLIHTGVHLDLPKNIFAQVNTRSSYGEQGMLLHHGVIDPGYTGEVSVWVMNLAGTTKENPFGRNRPFRIKKGDKIGQLLFHKAEYVDIEQISELPKTERGDKGHGSSGR